MEKLYKHPIVCKRPTSKVYAMKIAIPLTVGVRLGVLHGCIFMPAYGNLRSFEKTQDFKCIVNLN